MQQGAADASDNPVNWQAKEPYRRGVDPDDATITIEDHNLIVDGVEGCLPFFGGGLEPLRQLPGFGDIADNTKRADSVSGSAGPS